jgi:predicted negative regulator of RcsB-dependent stress response
VAKKRMTRKQLKQPDKVLSTMERGLQWVSQHRRVLLIGTAVVVVVVGAWILYRVRTASHATEAADLYKKGLRTYTAIIDPSIKGRQTGKAGEEGQAFRTKVDRAKAALKIFDRVVRDYEGFAVARAAHFYRGNCYYDLKKYSEAIAAYKKVLSVTPGSGCGCGGVDESGSDALKALALENLGYAQAAKGRVQDARQTFSKLRDLDKGTRRDWAYYHDALLKEQQGDLRGAIKSYEMVRQTGQSSKGQNPLQTFMHSPLNELSIKRARYLKMKIKDAGGKLKPGPGTKPGSIPGPGPGKPDPATSPSDQPMPPTDAPPAMDPGAGPAMGPGAAPAMAPAARPAAMGPAPAMGAVPAMSVAPAMRPAAMPPPAMPPPALRPAAAMGVPGMARPQ